jgi:hypothetical protein
MRGRGLLTVSLAVLAMACAAPAHAADWAHHALDDQYRLGDSVPLRDAPWVGTHNSFNSPAEMGPTLSDTDANQKIALTAQLDAGVRSIELDLHWFPSAGAGGFAPVVCHAADLHAGCSVEKPLGPVLDEIAGWLRENKRQVILLYAEDHLDSEEGYDTAAQLIAAKLPVYRPKGPGCTKLPLGLTRDDVRAANAQVIVVSGCGLGGGWPGVAFDWGGHLETRPVGYKDFPDCGPDFERSDYDTRLVRYFEDSTYLTRGGSLVGQSTADDGITPETAAAMSRCGVDLFGLDQVTSDDQRFGALVWSWAPGQPETGDCASLDAATYQWGRWRAGSCNSRFRAACRASDGSWTLSKPAVKAGQADAACRAEQTTHAVPRTGYSNQQLRLAMNSAGASRAWIAFRRGEQGWLAR